MSLLPLFDHYPQTPGYAKNRETSKQAAHDIKPSAETLRQKVYALLQCRELSADQCAELLEIDRLSVRPRVTELSKLGKIRDTGKRTLNSSGKKAIVWGAKR